MLMLFHSSIQRINQNPSIFHVKTREKNWRRQLPKQRRKTLFMEGEAKPRRNEASTASRIKRKWLSITTSFQESFRYIKATLLGQVKKLRAKNEKEASEADLTASKMQVDAAAEAEEIKKELDKSS